MIGCAWRARTFLTRFFLREIRNAVGLVVKPSGGLDARPYRMLLPTSLQCLQWVEVALPDIIC